MPPYAELSQERMGVWKRTPIFLRREVMTVMDMKTGFLWRKLAVRFSLSTQCPQRVQGTRRRRL